MRLESSVTSISWIPSEAVSGVMMKLPFESGSGPSRPTAPRRCGRPQRAPRGRSISICQRPPGVRIRGGGRAHHQLGSVGGGVDRLDDPAGR